MSPVPMLSCWGSLMAQLCRQNGDNPLRTELDLASQFRMGMRGPFSSIRGLNFFVSEIFWVHWGAYPIQ